MTRHTLYKAARLRLLIRFYAALLLLFAAGKCVFLAAGYFSGQRLSAADTAAVLLHGLSLDCATAGYFAAPLYLALLASLFFRIPRARILYMVYVALAAAAISAAITADAALYPFWHFKLDATVLAYLDAPQGAVQSVSATFLWAALTGFVTLATAGWGLLLRAAGRARGLQAARPKGWKLAAATAGFGLAGGLLFLGVRGGVGKSTANVGMVYFSPNQYLNHAAVNPVFSFLESASKARDIGGKCRYLDETARARSFAELGYGRTEAAGDTLLRTRRPDILLILMEGLGAQFVGSLGGATGVTPELERLAAEGIVFTRAYANSYRTDRGTVSALSGYPGFPNISVMKLPAKSRTLPSLARSLKREGYVTSFLYGGDKNFTNMNSYLLSTGYDRVDGDESFPVAQRRTHAWGVTDSILFDRLGDELARMRPAGRWFKTVLTLASHEPWKVPYSRLPGDEKANAMAYLDHCIGRFVDKLRRRPLWENLLIVILPDHGADYPTGVDEGDPRKWHIPVIWTGGAVKQPRRLGQIMNQSDLAATLLGQLGIDHADFRFSRDVTSPGYTFPSAFHCWGGGAALLSDDGLTLLDLQTGRLREGRDKAGVRRLKAYLQTIHDDLAAR
ncbi:MAG: LTA synthase family protein [Prevotellaceae bacterium]|nr:LTA synthase family protein [Prevotellaceae bacterium]